MLWLLRPQIGQIPIWLDHCHPSLQFHSRISEKLLISMRCISFVLTKLAKNLPHISSPESHSGTKPKVRFQFETHVTPMRIFH
jgi:hypothetical protein